MVQKIGEVVADYEKGLQEMPFVPSSSYGRPMLWEDGGPNRDILTYLFCERGNAFPLGRGPASE
jgi:hypothetical protein